MMRPIRIAVLIAALLAPAVASAQPRLSVGVTVGSTTDYYYHNGGGPAFARSGARDISIGVPLRYDLLRGTTLRVSAIGAMELTTPLAPESRGGTRAWLFGIETASRLGRGVAMTMTGLAGTISRRDDWRNDDDRESHGQIALEPGLRWRFGVLSMGLTYRIAWVRDVRFDSDAACFETCIQMLPATGAQTTSYDRVALSVGLPIGR